MRVIGWILVTVGVLMVVPTGARVYLDLFKAKVNESNLEAWLTSSLVFALGLTVTLCTY